MNPTLNILGISGSLRAQSRNTGLLRFAKQCLPPTVNFQIADLADVPFYNADRCDSKPEPVQMLIRQVTEADALVLACPEYNYSIAPALKNALDWVSREPERISYFIALKGEIARNCSMMGGRFSRT